MMMMVVMMMIISHNQFWNQLTWFYFGPGLSKLIKW